MMIDNNYAMAFTEVYTILINCFPESIELIPQNFINFINENKNNDYIYDFDSEKPIDEQKMLEETAAILTIIYREWFCTSEERAEIEEILTQNEIDFNNEQKEKYNVENIFKNESSIAEQPNTQLVVKSEKETVFQKIIKLIKNILKRND